MDSTTSKRLAIYGNLIPQDLSDNPKNWTLLLMESSRIIGIQGPFLARYSVTTYPTVPSGIYTRAIG